MKHIISSTLIIATLSFTGIANAQNSGAQGGAAAGAVTGAVGGALVGGPIGAVIGGVAGATIGAGAGSMTDEDKVYVQKYVYDNRGGYKSVEYKDQIVVGKPLPSAIKTYSFEGGNERVSKYRYTYVNDNYLLIDAIGNVLGSVTR